MGDLTVSGGSSQWRLVPADAPRATRQWLATRARILLRHGWQADMSDEELALVLADWIAALGDIPQEAVEQACIEWVRTEERRPTPAGIRKRALARVELAMSSYGGGDAPFAPEVVPEAELQRRRDMQERLRREFPMLKRMTTTEADG